MLSIAMAAGVCMPAVSAQAAISYNKTQTVYIPEYGSGFEIDIENLSKGAVIKKSTVKSSNTEVASISSLYHDGYSKQHTCHLQ